MAIFDLKIVIFLSGWGLCPQIPIASGSWGLCPQTHSYPNFSNLDPFSPFEIPAYAMVRTLRKARKNKIDPSELNDG